MDIEIANTDELIRERARLNALKAFLLEMKMIAENDDAVATFDREENRLRRALELVQSGQSRR